VAFRKNLDSVWVWFYKETAPMALGQTAGKGGACGVSEFDGAFPDLDCSRQKRGPEIRF
jgi:hypothetical protein